MSEREREREKGEEIGIKAGATLARVNQDPEQLSKSRFWSQHLLMLLYLHSLLLKRL